MFSLIALGLKESSNISQPVLVSSTLLLLPPINIPWHIWKELNVIIYEDRADFSTGALMDSISMFVRQWLLAKKIADAWLTANKLLPVFPRVAKIQVVKWLAPLKGRLKFKIDDSFTSKSKRGAEILRDEEGRFAHAASFQVAGSSPYHAELDASIKGIKWALTFFPLLVYETDALEILRRLENYSHFAQSPSPIDILATLIFENDILKSHTLCEEPSCRSFT
ncbi:unnamed protein product [Cuscuta campestris]|uniref:RNase H type-1 domain-containing protein n=1 Tax=Cuscuta campestris TaxID=132261 RepID=A0A484MLU3_9ASTE|nr:unnamed protein product [Cuscuta campestris]